MFRQMDVFIILANATFAVSFFVFSATNRSLIALIIELGVAQGTHCLHIFPRILILDHDVRAYWKLLRQRWVLRVWLLFYLMAGEHDVI